jgi:DNA polymerase V
LLKKLAAMIESLFIMPVADVLTTTEISFFEGRVPAGFPSPALDYAEGTIDFNKMLIHNKESTFVVRVKGDSLIDAHVVPGSHLVVDKSIFPNSGDLVVATVYGDFTVKFYKVEGQRIWLVPANKNYRPLEINECHEFSIWGVVTHIIMSPKQIY